MTVSLTASGGGSFPGGDSQAVAADSIHRVIVHDDGASLFAPDSFPTKFLGGLFVPFSGKSGPGGPANDEKPLVFVDPVSGSLFHCINNGVMGHPNGVLVTRRRLRRRGSGCRWFA